MTPKLPLRQSPKLCWKHSVLKIVLDKILLIHSMRRSIRWLSFELLPLLRLALAFLFFSALVLGILRQVCIKKRVYWRYSALQNLPITFQESWRKSQARKGDLEARAEMSEEADHWCVPAGSTEVVQQPWREEAD